MACDVAAMVLSIRHSSMSWGPMPDDQNTRPLLSHRTEQRVLCLYSTASHLDCHSLGHKVMLLNELTGFLKCHSIIWGWVCWPIRILCEGDQKSVWYPLCELRRDPTQEAVRSFSKPQHCKGTRKYTSGSWKDLCVFSCNHHHCTCMPAPQFPCSLFGWSKIIRPWGGCGRVHLGPQHTTETSRKVWRSRSSLANQWIRAQPGLHERLSRGGEKNHTNACSIFQILPQHFKFQRAR